MSVVKGPEGACSAEHRSSLCGSDRRSSRGRWSDDADVELTPDDEAEPLIDSDRLSVVGPDVQEGNLVPGEDLVQELREQRTRMPSPAVLGERAYAADL